MLDEEPQVRKALLTLFRSLFTSIDKMKFQPFISKISAYSASSMTHLQLDIRIDSLKFLDLFLDTLEIDFLDSSSLSLIDHFLGLFTSDISNRPTQGLNTNQFSVFNLKHLLLTTFGKYLHFLFLKENRLSFQSSHSSIHNSNSSSSLFLLCPEPKIILSEFYVAHKNGPFSSMSTNTFNPSKLISSFSTSILHTWIETSQKVFSKCRVEAGASIEVCNACVKSLYYAWALHKSLPDSKFLKNYKKTTLRHFLVYFPFGKGLQADEKAGKILLSTNVYMTEILRQLYPEETSLILPCLKSLFQPKANSTLSAEQLALLGPTLENFFLKEPCFLDNFLKWLQILRPNRPVKSAAIQLFTSFLKKSNSHRIKSSELLYSFCLDLVDSLCCTDVLQTSFVEDALLFLRYIFSSFQMKEDFLVEFASKLAPFFCHSKSENEFGPFLKLSSRHQCLVIDFLYYLKSESFHFVFQALNTCLQVPTLPHDVQSRASNVLNMVFKVTLECSL
ncbi:hypothetical protein HMI56_002330 [Coelomomyces lativittatus]|nr:hypothetical protein HMI56_002330 [Coelomomyces lativittatus]